MDPAETSSERGCPLASDNETEPYPFGPAQGLELHPRYAELRRYRPVTRVRMPYGGEAWLVTRYEDIKAVLSDARLSRAASVGKDVPRGTPGVPRDSTIVFMDPPEHTRLRQVIGGNFTPRRIERLQPRAQAIVDGLVEEMIEAGPPADLAAAVAWPLPFMVICEMLGVPMDDWDRIRTTTEEFMTLSFPDPKRIERARADLDAYLSDLVARRRAKPADDLLGALVAARDEDDRLSEAELIRIGVSLLVAGHDTTANHIASFVYTLLSRPRYWHQLVADRDLLGPAIEELLRATPLTALANLPRIATADLEIGGQQIRAGEAVVLQLASANQDAAVFDHPEEIDFTRVKNPHLGFSFGIHHCAGMHLARMELRVALGTLLSRLPRLTLAVPADEVRWRTNRLVRGLEALPVTW